LTILQALAVLLGCIRWLLAEQLGVCLWSIWWRWDVVGLVGYVLL